MSKRKTYMVEIEHFERTKKGSMIVVATTPQAAAKNASRIHDRNPSAVNWEDSNTRERVERTEFKPVEMPTLPKGGPRT